MNSDKIFNPKALEKLRSPDKLDSMIRITGPVGWMGLATVALLCFAIVLWSVYGSFTEKAEGYGLIWRRWLCFALPLCCGLCMVLLRKKQKDTD